MSCAWLAGPSRCLALSLLAALLSGCPFSSFEVEPGSGTSVGGAGGGASGGAPAQGGNTAGQAPTPIKPGFPQPRSDQYFMLQGSALHVRGPGVLANDSPSGLDVETFDELTEAEDFPTSSKVNRDGSLDFTPDPRFFGVFELSYRVVNSNGESASSKITVHVLPVDIDLALVGKGLGGVVLSGGSGHQLGSAIHAAGDVNGDAVDDLLIGAPGADEGAGAAFVVFGNAFLKNRELSSSPAADQAQYYTVLNGVLADGRLGTSVSSIQVGGKTTALLLGEPGGLGRVELLALGELSDVTVPMFNPVRRSEFVGDEREAGVGRLVAGAGDIDADGLPDFLLASQVGERGQLRVVFGQEEPTAPSTAVADAPGLVLPASDDQDGFPLALAAAGDLNDDGASDVLTASSTNILLLDGGADFPMSENEVSIDGTAHGYRATRAAPGSGAAVAAIGELTSNEPELAYCDGAVVCRVVRGPVSTLTGGFRVSGFSPSATTVSVAAAGDVDSDGVADLAFAEDSVAYVIYGRRAAQSDVNVSSLGGLGYRLRMPEDGKITAISTAGDWNDDGVADLVISDAGADRRTGRVYVVFGIASR